MVKEKFRVFAVVALSLAILAAGAFVLPGVSAAAEKGIYIEGRAGAVFADDSKFDTTTQQDAEHDIGWGTGLGLGYAYGNGVRGELGLDYRQSDIDKVGGVGASGTARAGSLMISGYYDFFRDSIVQPYLGAGFGLAGHGGHRLQHQLSNQSVVGLSVFLHSRSEIPDRRRRLGRFGLCKP